MGVVKSMVVIVGIWLVANDGEIKEMPDCINKRQRRKVEGVSAHKLERLRHLMDNLGPWVVSKYAS